jgi:hypothetical protein
MTKLTFEELLVEGKAQLSLINEPPSVPQVSGDTGKSYRESASERRKR